MKKSYPFVFFGCFFLNAASQDASFANSQQSLLNLNPSFAGTNGFVRSQSSYRLRWPNLLASYALMGNNTDVYIPTIKAGIGATALYENMSRGLMVDYFYALSYAQHFSFRQGDLKII